jgi:hypothetical protein
MVGILRENEGNFPGKREGKVNGRRRGFSWKKGKMGKLSGKK